MLTKLKSWLGLAPHRTMNEDDAVNRIWRIHAVLDAVYGKGFAKENPAIVAQFMLASEVAALREIIGSGSGAITVGLEHAAPSA